MPAPRQGHRSDRKPRGPCRICGAEVPRPGRPYCSRRCLYEGQRRTRNAGQFVARPDITGAELEAEFWKRVDVRGPDDCWPWRLRPTGNDYALFQIARPTVYAHRYSAMIAAGRDSLETWEFVIHSCDNRPCCNPAHLTIADHAANMADMVAKERSPRCNGKLTFAEAEDIRRRCANGERQRVVAGDFGIVQQTVSDVVRGKILTRS